MDEHLNTKKSKVSRIGGYLHRIIPIADKSGKILSYVLKPHQVEFRPRDILQVMVGASLMAVPVSLTEEAWTLGERLPLLNIGVLAFLSLLLIAAFVYFNFYRNWFEGQVSNYLQRVLGTYLISLMVVALILTIIQKCPWGVDNLLAIKRIIIVGFPASMTATVSDTVK